MKDLQAVVKWIDGRKTYLAASGLLALAYYRLTQHDYDGAAQAVGQALAAAGLRHAVAKATAPSQPKE